jgi:hypothetical protein
MRPLTSSLYVPPPLTLKGRPWWSSAEVEGDGYYEDRSVQWTRRDGWTIHSNGYSYYVSPPEYDPGREVPEGASVEVLAAAVDAAHPLPPPQLRAGQVWLLEARQAWVTALLNTTMQGFLRTSEETAAHLRPGGLLPGDTMYGVEAFANSPSRRRWADEEGRHATMGFNHALGPGYLLGDQFLLAHDAERLLLHDDPLIKAYLIADPVDPSKVPWTAAKEGEW